MSLFSWLNPIGELVGKVVDLAGGFIERKQKIAVARAEADAKVIVAEAEARAKLAEKSLDAEIEWDREGASQMRYSWKDEYFVIVWTAPLWLSMFPFEWSNRASAAFFQTIDTAPEWYVNGMAVMIAASFGVRQAIHLIRKLKE